MAELIINDAEWAGLTQPAGIVGRFMTGLGVNVAIQAKINAPKETTRLAASIQPKFDYSAASCSFNVLARAYNETGARPFNYARAQETGAFAKPGKPMRFKSKKIRTSSGKPAVITLLEVPATHYLTKALVSANLAAAGPHPGLVYVPNPAFVPELGPNQ